MHRRHFLSTSLAGAATIAAIQTTATQVNAAESKVNPFQMNFGPHFGMFRQLSGKDLIDQLNFAADEGFTAWEDNGMKRRSLDLQNKIAKTMEQRGIQMGVVSALIGIWGKVNFAGNNKNNRDEILKGIKEIVEVAKRVNSKWLTVVPGLQAPKLPRDYQMVNCIELLKRCCDILEPHGLVMVLEPLNHLTNHPGTFLYESPQAYLICKAVNSPSCKILFDIYHQQITEGNLIPNIDKAWEEIGYFQCGDNPGRNEPGTGEINYKNVFQHIHDKGFKGVMGMEHGTLNRTEKGERALIDAYRKVNPTK